jgi:hypothetical protein
VNPSDRVRIGLCDLFDVDAALGTHHAEEFAMGSVQQERAVVLLFDIAGSFDENPLDRVSFDVHPEDLLCDRASFVGVLCKLDPAGLAAAPDLDLGLDYDSTAQTGCCIRGLVRGRRDAALGDRYVELTQQLFALVLEKIQDPPPATARL